MYLPLSMYLYISMYLSLSMYLYLSIYLSILDNMMIVLSVSSSTLRLLDDATIQTAADFSARNSKFQSVASGSDKNMHKKSLFQ